MTWQFTLTGLLIGGLVGLTGMGGGSLLTPILVILFGFQPTYAVGTDILHGAIFKSFGAVRHRRLGTVHARLVFWMFLGSGPMSLLGVAFATWLTNTYGDGVQSVEAYAIGAALVLGGIGLVAKTLIKLGMQPDDAPLILTRRDRWIAVTIGAVFGFVVGLTSVGSGTFFGLVMVLVYPLTISKIVGTDILHGAIFKSFGAIRHRRLGTVHARLTFWMFLGSGPMSLLGVSLATSLSHHYGDGVQSIEAYAIGAALVLGGLGLVAKTVVKVGVQPDDAPFLLTRRDRWIAFAIGAVFGFVVGLTSVGSGTFFGLVMLLVYPLTVAKIVGTDIFHAAALLWVAGVGHLVAGNVDLHAMAWLLLGSIPGVLLTSQLTLRLPGEALRLGLATVLILSGIKLVNAPGADWIVLAGFIVGGIFFAAWGAREVRDRRREERLLGADLTLS